MQIVGISTKKNPSMYFGCIWSPALRSPILPYCQEQQPKLEAPSLRSPNNNPAETYESTGVVVPDSLGIAKRFQQWVGLENDIFNVLEGKESNISGIEQETSKAKWN